jgi:hypothetical protein
MENETVNWKKEKEIMKEESRQFISTSKESVLETEKCTTKVRRKKK